MKQTETEINLQQTIFEFYVRFCQHQQHHGGVAQS